MTPAATILLSPEPAALLPLAPPSPVSEPELPPSASGLTENIKGFVSVGMISEGLSSVGNSSAGVVVSVGAEMESFPETPTATSVASISANALGSEGSEGRIWSSPISAAKAVIAPNGRQDSVNARIRRRTTDNLTAFKHIASFLGNKKAS